MSIGTTPRNKMLKAEICVHSECSLTEENGSITHTIYAIETRRPILLRLKCPGEPWLTIKHSGMEEFSQGPQRWPSSTLDNFSQS